MPYGFTGKILHVDLSAGELSIEEPPESFTANTWGQRHGPVLHASSSLVPPGLSTARMKW